MLELLAELLNLIGSIGRAAGGSARGAPKSTMLTPRQVKLMWALVASTVMIGIGGSIAILYYMRPADCAVWYGC